jgi:uncharacterized repeat protein (TIGR01451 family)
MVPGRGSMYLLWLVLLGPGFAHATPSPSPAPGTLAALRLPFIANEGQVDAQVAYYAPTFAGTVFVTRQGRLVYALPGPRSSAARGKPATVSGPGWSLTEAAVDGTAHPVARDRGAARVSTFVGDDPARWRSALPTSMQIGLGEVWPGVTVALRARGGGVEKVFTVEPGASVDLIRIRVGGATTLSVDPAGALVAGTGLGPVTFTPPLAYQERDGVRRAVAVAYRVRGREYGFTVGDYDRTVPLVVDPLLQSTYLGGSAIEQARALAIHPMTGEVYVAGVTGSINFPGTAGGAQPTNPGTARSFVARLNSSLTTLLQATYLGGSEVDSAETLTIHPTTGDVYVAGSANSSDFPHAAGGAQPTKAGFADGFVARLNSTLTTLIQATYLGGTGADSVGRLAIHPATGDVYVVGTTDSTDLIGVAGGAQPAYGGGFRDAFVARLNSALTAVGQATYLGGSSYDIGVAITIHPTTGDVYVSGGTQSTDFPGVSGGAQTVHRGGFDGFVARLPASLTTLIQATYLGGGPGAERNDFALALAIHPATGDVYAVGEFDFFTDVGGEHAEVARLTSALTTLVRTVPLIGSDGVSAAFSVAIHPASGEVYVAGYTNSSDFPGTVGSAQPANAGGVDVFVARLDSVLSVVSQATYLGGGGDDFGTALTIHPVSGEVYVAGRTVSTDFPGTAGGARPASGGGEDAFVARLTADLVTATPGPDLTVHKTHTTEFVPGRGGATYTLRVRNVGTGVTTGTVTVTDTLPAGLTATALSGAGWSCTLATLTCTRSDPLASGSSYPIITLTVTVAADASDSVTNTAKVSGGGDVAPGNNTATDRTPIVPPPDLRLTKTHAFDFFPGSPRLYTLTVSNFSPTGTAGTVTVTDTLPAGLTAIDMSGPGWTCALGTLTCTRDDVLFGGTSYPAITLTVSVNADAPASVTNTATASGGGDLSPGNNSATDPTTIVKPDLAITKVHSGNFTRGQVGATYTITVRNAAPVETTGMVTVTDTLPAGLTATALGGAGWSCTLATLTCTRGDTLSGFVSYPSITLTVNVSASPPNSVTNVATVSGGGDVNPGNNTASDVTEITRFADVPSTNPFISWIEALFNAGLTSGCNANPLQYCPDAGVTRAEVAVFLLRGIHGAGFEPPAPTGTMFTDVPASHPFAKWIEQLAREGLTGGCSASPPQYCPDETLTRGQAAMLLLVAEHGVGFSPPAATGTVFADVPAGHPFAKWIERLRIEGITGGCTATTYCPDVPVTRGQIAVFLIRAFTLPFPDERTTGGSVR